MCVKCPESAGYTGTGYISCSSVHLLFYLLFFACFFIHDYHIVYLLISLCVCTCGCVCVCVFVCTVCVCVFAWCVHDLQQSRNSNLNHLYLFTVYCYPSLRHSLSLFPSLPVWRLCMGQHECCMHNERIDVKLKTARTTRAPAGVAGPHEWGAALSRTWLYLLLYPSSHKCSKTKGNTLYSSKEYVFPVYAKKFNRKFFVEIRLIFFSTQVWQLILKLK